MSRVKLSQILDAISRPIAEAFPDRYVYIGQLPKGFQRPSFFLQLVTTASRRQNIGTDETDVYLTLTIHEDLNLTRKGNQTAALDDTEKVTDLFRLGVLPVADRMLPVAASEGGQNEGEAYLELTVTLRDGVGYDPEKDLPIISKVICRTVLDGKDGGEL